MFFSMNNQRRRDISINPSHTAWKIQWTIFCQEHWRILFIVERIIIGLILFPIVVLFWQCGWNLVLILLNFINGYPLHGSEQSKTLADSLSLTVSQESADKEYLADSFSHNAKKRKGLSRPSPFLIENHNSLILNLEEEDYSVYYYSSFSPLFLSRSRFFLQFSEETK
jgi:hypothetical protein